MRKKCYIYTRVSTAAQTEGYSLEAQTERLRKYADYKEMEVVREYCDAGKSGKSITGRPEFQRMMASMKAGKLDCIIVKDLSRFGRDYLETGYYLETILPKLNVRFIAITDHYDSLTADKNTTSFVIPERIL